MKITHALPVTVYQAFDVIPKEGFLIAHMLVIRADAGDCGTSSTRCSMQEPIQGARVSSYGYENSRYVLLT